MVQDELTHLGWTSPLTLTLTTSFGANYPPMQGYPPQHRRFEDKKIPNHITYAFKKDATIVRNDDFYQLPKGKTKNVDLLFVIAHAPVKTASLPEAGSGPYVGLANAMELAVNELSKKFPAFFVEERQLSNWCEI